MPTKHQHQTKAADNEAFADYVDLNQRAAVDWVLTVLFYAAVHYVEAYFAKQGIHSTTHTTRIASIRQDPTLRAIYRNYQELLTYSRDARYDVVALGAQDIQDVRPNLEMIKNLIRPLL